MRPLYISVMKLCGTSGRDSTKKAVCIVNMSGVLDRPQATYVLSQHFDIDSWLILLLPQVQRHAVEGLS